MKPSKIAPYTMALLWTCTQCGFVKEGKQPHNECPSCESSKAAYINLPQHLENEIRAELEGGQSPNCTSARQHRTRLLTEHGMGERYMVKGRFVP